MAVQKEKKTVIIKQNFENAEIVEIIFQNA